MWTTLGACIAVPTCLAVPVFFCLLADQSQYTAHDVAHGHFPRLGGTQPLADALHTFNELCHVRDSLGRNDPAYEVGCRNGAWS